MKKSMAISKDAPKKAFDKSQYLLVNKSKAKNLWQTKEKGELPLTKNLFFKKSTATTKEGLHEKSTVNIKIRSKERCPLSPL